MDYEDLEEYEGDKTACDNCDREFTDGEVITVDSKGHTFCYSDDHGGCLIAFVFSFGETVFDGDPVRFKGSKWHEPDNPMPNYPNTPVNKKKAEENHWLRKVLGSLNT